MDTIILVAIVILGLLFISVVFVFMRLRKVRAEAAKPALEEALESEANVEYEWTSKPSLARQILPLMMLLAFAVVYLWLGDGEDNDLVRILQTFALFGGSMFGVFAASKPQMFQVTAVGLFQMPPDKKTERKLVFTWADLLWFKPLDDGFRYYLRPITTAADRTGHSGSKIRCGKDAMFVNSHLMARGVPTSPPSQDVAD